MRALLCATTLGVALLFGGGSSWADHSGGGTGAAAPGGVTAAGDTAPGGSTAPGGTTTAAQNPPCEALNGMPKDVHKRKSGPVRKIIKGVAKETVQDLKDMADDSIFVFSVDSFGPDHTTSNTRPYEAYELTLMNGDISSVTAFPDASFRINGGTFGGTCACKDAEGHYIVYYPNGAKGRIKSLGGGSFEVLRPDNTITFFKKTSTGGWRISNSSTGYAGEMTPDEADVGWKLGPAGY